MSFQGNWKTFEATRSLQTALDELTATFLRLADCMCSHCFSSYIYLFEEVKNSTTALKAGSHDVLLYDRWRSDGRRFTLSPFSWSKLIPVRTFHLSQHMIISMHKNLLFLSRVMFNLAPNTVHSVRQFKDLRVGLSWNVAFEYKKLLLL